MCVSVSFDSAVCRFVFCFCFSVVVVFGGFFKLKYLVLNGNVAKWQIIMSPDWADCYVEMFTTVNERSMIHRAKTESSSEEISS